MKSSQTTSMTSVQALLESLVSVMRDSSAGKFDSGLDWTSRAPEFARSFDVPLWRAVSSHFASEGLSKIVGSLSI